MIAYLRDSVYRASVPKKKKSHIRLLINNNKKKIRSNPRPSSFKNVLKDLEY